jgi:hypothetical protein
MPEFKEAPIFCMEEERAARALAWLMSSGFAEVSPDVLLGKVATYYMMGLESVDVYRVAERVERAFPTVRLIALLRDPIERAMSHYRMSVRRGFEKRSFDALVEEHLTPRELELGRTRPSETNSYLVQGEYGRILRVYLRRFPTQQLHVELTADLESEPGSTVDRILDFLGLAPGHRPPGLDVRHHVGGTAPRLDPAGEADLVEFMEEQIWPRLGDDVASARHAFTFFLQTWNVIPDDARPDISPANRGRLEEHYRADAELLRPLDLIPPWLESWDRANRT